MYLPLKCISQLSLKWANCSNQQMASVEYLHMLELLSTDENWPPCFYAAGWKTRIKFALISLTNTTRTDALAGNLNHENVFLRHIKATKSNYGGSELYVWIHDIWDRSAIIPVDWSRHELCNWIISGLSSVLLSIDAGGVKWEIKCSKLETQIHTWLKGITVPDVDCRLQ